MKTIITILLVIMTCHSINVYASGLPKEIHELAKQNNCSEVTGFYDRPGMVEPPFLYGYVQTMSKSKSVIFWCKSNKDVNTYKLIAHIKAKTGSGCFEVIHETKNFPGGLSFSTEKFSGLAGYRTDSLTTTKHKCGVEGIIVRSVYDGVGYTFIFHSGTWMYKMWD